MKAKIRRSGLYDPSQARMDTWNDLQNQVRWLAEAKRRGEEAEESLATVKAILDSLASLERYWAFPGSRSVEELRNLVARSAYTKLATRTANLVRLLVGDAYRDRVARRLQRSAAGLRERDEDDEARRERPGTMAPTAKPYFEVLFVDVLEEEEEWELRQRLDDVRRDEDEFVYDSVIVPSLEDAVIAVLFNHTIQSVVLRYSFPFSSDAPHEALARYLEIVADAKLEDTQGLERSFGLAHLIKRSARRSTSSWSRSRRSRTSRGVWGARSGARSTASTTTSTCT